MTIDQVINILVTITLLEMMVAVGLGVAGADLIGVAKNWRLVAQAMLANYVCVPAITVGLLLLFQSQPLVSAGFLILAVCPGAPFGPPCTSIAKGNVALAVGLMALLAGSSAVLAPLLLQVLLPLMSGNEPLKIDAARLVGTLLVTQLIPLCVGLLVHQRWPVLAERLQKPANQLSLLLNVLVVSVILIARCGMLIEIRPRGYLGMLALLIASLTSGWLLGGPRNENRRAMSLTTSLRNVGVGLVIATGSFSGTPAVTATLAYGLFDIIGSLLLALWWGRTTFARDHQGVNSGHMSSIPKN